MMMIVGELVWLASNIATTWYTGTFLFFSRLFLIFATYSFPRIKYICIYFLLFLLHASGGGGGGESASRSLQMVLVKMKAGCGLTQAA